MLNEQDNAFLSHFKLWRSNVNDTIRALKNAKIDWQFTKTGITLTYIDGVIEKLRG